MIILYKSQCKEYNRTIPCVSWCKIQISPLLQHVPDHICTFIPHFSTSLFEVLWSISNLKQWLGNIGLAFAVLGTTNNMHFYSLNSEMTRTCWQRQCHVLPYEMLYTQYVLVTRQCQWHLLPTCTMEIHAFENIWHFLFEWFMFFCVKIKIVHQFQHECHTNTLI